MTFTWTPHRFVGGSLALDVANSVVLRPDPDRRTDRFAVAEQLHAFSDAACRFSAERALFGELKPVRSDNHSPLLALREAIDAYFRKRAEGEEDRQLLADLLDKAAVMLRRASSDTDLEAATAHSAVRLLTQSETERIKICGNCGWLFIDRSRNRSRAWCDMAICGNRVKASRHYHRTKKEVT